MKRLFVLAGLAEAKVRPMPSAGNFYDEPIVKSHERNVRDNILVRCSHPSV